MSLIALEPSWDGVLSFAVFRSWTAVVFMAGSSVVLQASGYGPTACGPISLRFDESRTGPSPASFRNACSYQIATLASGPIPTFASCCGRHFANAGIERPLARFQL